MVKRLTWACTASPQHQRSNLPLPAPLSTFSSMLSRPTLCYTDAAQRPAGGIGAPRLASPSDENHLFQADCKSASSGSPKPRLAGVPRLACSALSAEHLVAGCSASISPPQNKHIPESWSGTARKRGTARPPPRCTEGRRGLLSSA